MPKYPAESINKAIESFKSDKNMEDGLPWVVSFEDKFTKFVGAKYGIALNSATSGLHAALLACGVGNNDEVISPALTVIMDAFATEFVGAKPVFVDVDTETWNLDPNLVKQNITRNTKAIITVSWFGLPSDLESLREIADENNLYLIDDSAETIIVPKMGDSEKGIPDLRVFSFENNKHMTLGGEGGMVTTNNSDLAIKCRKFGGLGYKHLSAERGRTQLDARTFQNPNYERFDTLGLNYRLTPLQAAVGLGQLESLNDKLEMRKKCAKKFLQVIKDLDIDWLVPQTGLNLDLHSYYTFGVYLNPLKIKFTWQDFYDAFTSAGGDGFYANCKVPYKEPIFLNKYKDVSCPVAEKLQSGIMAFKTNYYDDERLERNIDIFRDTIKKFL